MNNNINTNITKELDLSISKSYLLIYICHELSHSDIADNRSIDITFVLNNFDFIFKHSKYDVLFINNILYILTQTMKHSLDKKYYICNRLDMNKIINIYNILLSQPHTYTLIVQSYLFEENLDYLFIYIHNYIITSQNYSDMIMNRICVIFNLITIPFIKRYLFQKICLYKNIELNNNSFEEKISNDFIIFIICSYILSFYVLKYNITYTYTPDQVLDINVNHPMICIYNEDLSKIIRTAHVNDCYFMDSHTSTDIVHNTIFKYLLKLFNITILPVLYKLEQIKADIDVTNRSINEVDSSYVNTITNNNFIVKALINHKMETEHKYNTFNSLIHNEKFNMMIIAILNGIFKYMLLDDIQIESYVIDFTVLFLKKFYYTKMTLENYIQFRYIILGLLNIINKNIKEVNIYTKCLIIEIITFNKYFVILLLQENENTYTCYTKLLLTSLLHMYNYIEDYKSFDINEKFFIRNNILLILKQLMLDTTTTKDIFLEYDLSSMLFLFLQDTNFFFEHIIDFIKYNRINRSHTTITKISNYTLFIKESFSFLVTLLQYDKDIMFNKRISNNLITNINTYINIIFDRTNKYFFFNFNNINVYFSWKNDIMEKMYTLFTLYKDDEAFHKLLLVKGSNYKSDNIKNLDRFIRPDSIYDNNNNNSEVPTKTNIDILINNVLSLKYSFTINIQEVPDKFLDPILMDIIKEPLLLPDSNIIVDKYMIYNHLLINKTDPFTQLYLDKQQVIEHNNKMESIEKIRVFKEEYQSFVDEYMLQHNNNKINNNSDETVTNNDNDTDTVINNENNDIVTINFNTDKQVE